MASRLKLRVCLRLRLRSIAAIQQREKPTGMKCNWLLFAVILLGGTGMMQSVNAEGASATAVQLWPGAAPGALGTEPKDIPTLTPFLAPAEKATGAAIVVCPGGGYANLTAHEGNDYAHWLNELGISAFVLRYRLGSNGYRHPVMMQDATRAMRTVRAHAAEWKVDPKRVGIIGSSAGGHLASTIMTHYDAGDPNSTDTVERQSSRPDLGILCYAVISFGEKGHRGSEKNLLGDNPPEDLQKSLSNELQVTTDTCQAFLFHTADDHVVDVENSLLFAQAMVEHKVPVDLHIYTQPKHNHGLGLGAKIDNPAGRHIWTLECAKWLKQQGFAN
jgi:acetyl esterase/lipase